jgi:uncharacterized protein YjiS (DUF1127 family)
MTTIHDAGELGQAAVSISGLSGFFRKCRHTIREWRDRERLRTALDQLSDKELRDIGITRGEIDYVARAARSIDPRDCR